MAEDGVRRPEGTIQSYKESVHHQYVSTLANLETLAKHTKAMYEDFWDGRKYNISEDSEYANQSFVIDGITEDEHEAWQKMVDELLHSGFWVTLDYDVKFHEEVLENGWNEHDQFISMISVKLPYVNQLNYNACIKIDDKDFKATNPGVWVSYVQQHLDRDKFTGWERYKDDKEVNNE